MGQAVFAKTQFSANPVKLIERAALAVQQDNATELLCILGHCLPFVDPDQLHRHGELLQTFLKAARAHMFLVLKDGYWFHIAFKALD
jgi:hypothetical protein